MRSAFILPEQTKPLRHQVLWPHIEKEENCVIDIDQREDAFHVGTFDGEELISVGSFFRMSSPKIHALQPYRLRAMATSPMHRGKNAGRFLIEFALVELKKRKVDILWCDARLNATGFYQSLGFSVFEEIYDVPLIGPHQFMWIEV